MDTKDNLSQVERLPPDWWPSMNPLDPFNHYNREFVKLDANRWLDDPDGQDRMVHLEGLQFGLLISSKRQAELFAKLVPDSVNNKSFTDVTFIVGPAQHSKKYVGHRVLLAMTSPVFETMFYGDMADKNKYIRIPDVAPIGFENLLRFAYTDSLNLGSVEDAMLTAYAAKKYLLPQLLRDCLAYIEHNISYSNACVVFEFAQVLNSQQLVLQAMNIMDRQTSGLIAKRSFTSAQPSTVEFLANRKYLTLTSEYSLFCALLQWSLAECRRRQLTTPGEPIDWLQIRAIMLESNLLRGVRFLAMSQEEFARLVSKSSSLIVIPDQATASSSTSLTHLEQVEDQPATCEDNKQQSERETHEPSDDHQHATLGAAARVNTESANSLLLDCEQRAVFMNLALPGSAALPDGLNGARLSREPPPEMFTLNRFRNQQHQLITSITSTRKIQSIYTKFSCLNENIFILAITLPIRLDPVSYINKTPKFECHLKFTTRQTLGQQQGATSGGAGPSSGGISASIAANCDQQQQLPIASQGFSQLEQSTLNCASMLMDSLDESLHISISRDKDCFVRLKRPILIRMGNINELSLTFQNYASDEEVTLRSMPSSMRASNSEMLDDELIKWQFLKPHPTGVTGSGQQVELSEIHYYY